MMYNADAYYMDMETNENMKCGDTNAYCAANPNGCGDVAMLPTYFATTDCCTGKTTHIMYWYTRLKRFCYFCLSFVEFSDYIYH